MKAYLWVVEMCDKEKWLPTIGACLTRADARAEKRLRWERKCPDYKFRIRKYVREDA